MKLVNIISLIIFSSLQLFAGSISHAEAEKLLISSLSSNSKSAQFRDKYANLERDMVEKNSKYSNDEIKVYLKDSKAAKFRESYLKMEEKILHEHVKSINLDSCSLDSMKTILMCNNSSYPLR